MLIGEVGTGIHDEQPVPVSFGSAMPGVEIHANAIQTILTGRFLVEQPASWTIGIILALVVICMAVFIFTSIGISLLFLIGALIAYFIASVFLFEYGLLLNSVYPYLAIAVSFIVAYVVRYFLEVRAGRKIEQAFSRYVNQAVVKKIIENPDQLKLGGEKRIMTVFFSDIADFTSISEELTAEALVELLNEYLDVVSKIVLNHEGSVDKYIGDAVMAFFGAPLPQEDHAIKACMTALDYQKALKPLQKKWTARGLKLHARIGINTGEMVVGNIGSHHRFDYTVIGDAVNLASRLEGLNKLFHTSILISSATYTEVTSFIEAREVDLIRVKGKKKPVRIYELISRKGKLTAIQKKAFLLFSAALDLYRKKSWHEAKEHFKKVTELLPEDGPSICYIERCSHFLQEGNAPEDWDGVFSAEHK